MEWLTLEEVAKFENITYNACQLRYHWYTNTKTEKSDNGGKNRVYIELSCLSETAQAKYKRHKDYINRQKPREQAKRKDDYIPWYYKADITEYMSMHKEQYLEKSELAEVLDTFLEQKQHIKKHLIEFTTNFAKEKLNISYKHFRELLNRYEEGEKWGEIIKLETGIDNIVSYKIIALCKPPRQSTPKALTEEMQSIIQNIWSSEIYQKNNQTVVMLYDKFCEKLAEKGIEYRPCLQTVRRYVGKLEKQFKAEKTYIKYVERGFKHSAMIKSIRNTGKLKVMQLVQGDAHTFDCWVEYTNDSGVETAKTIFSRFY